MQPRFALSALASILARVRGRGPLGVLIAVVGLAVGHALVMFPAFVEDDAFISFRYADRLMQGRWLTWSDGPPVEGYSDLLWVLLVAPLAPLGVPHLTAARMLGLLGLVAAVGSASVDPGTVRPNPVRALSGGLGLALAGALPAWAMGGLEQTFLAGLVGVALHLVLRHAAHGDRAAWTALVLAAMALTRLDGFVLVAGILAGGVVATRSLRPWLVVAALPALVLLGQQAHRVVFYGDWVPNTARVKVSGTSDRAWFGLEWTLGGLKAHAALVVGAVGGAWGQRLEQRIVVPAATVLAWCAYTVGVGGDIFAAWRQLVPCLPALGMLAGEAACRLSPRPRWVLVGAALLAHVPLANFGDGWPRARVHRREWDVAPMARVLVRAWGHRDPLIAVDAAGALPYFTRFRSLDMLGLNDHWLPRHPSPWFGGRMIGHDLGDPDYVWRSEPDLIAFNSGLGTAKPSFFTGVKLPKRKDFEQRYQTVVLTTRGSGGKKVVAQYFVRREGGRLGVDRSSNRIEVPGWFLASNEEHPARWANGALVVEASNGPAVVPALALPAGVWRVRTEPPGPEAVVVCGIVRSGSRVELPNDRKVDLVVTGSGPVERLVLERTDARPVVRCKR